MVWVRETIGRQLSTTAHREGKELPRIRCPVDAGRTHMKTGNWARTGCSASPRVLARGHPRAKSFESQTSRPTPHFVAFAETMKWKTTCGMWTMFMNVPAMHNTHTHQSCEHVAQTSSRHDGEKRNAPIKLICTNDQMSLAKTQQILSLLPNGVT